MSRRDCSAVAARGRGFTLIEMMVALLLGLIVLGTLVMVMQAVIRGHRASVAVSTLQENARYSMEMMTRDVRHAGAQFCMNYSGATDTPTLTQVQVTEAVRGVQARFDVGLDPFRLGTSGHDADYLVDAAYFLQGFECATDGDSCSPDPDSFAPLAAQPVPAIGIAPGQRARGSDILYLRHLSGNGIDIVAQGAEDADGQAATLTLGAGPDPLPSAGNAAVVLADCSSAILARVAASGNQLTLAGNFNDDVLPKLETEHQARAFDLGEALQEIVYYVAIRQVPAQSGVVPKTVSSLIRRVDGVEHVVADGIERFDLLYHLEQRDGRVVAVGADQVPAAQAQCRSLTQAAAGSDAIGTCGWRSIVGIDIHLLATSIERTGASASSSFRYSWRNDGSRNVSGFHEDPAALATLANGLPAEAVTRKEFHSFVAVRGYNP